MAEDWRVRVSVPDRSHADADPAWTALIRALRARISADIVISQTRGRVFLYAPSAGAAAQAEQAVRTVLAGHDVKAEVRRDRWNSISTSWTSHEDLMRAERRRSAATGQAAWQVRAGPSSQRELTDLARRLQAEGYSVVRRWRHLFTGANCEDDAHALASRIRGHGSGSGAMRIQVQPVYDRPPPVRVPGQHGLGGGWYQADGDWHPA